MRCKCTSKIEQNTREPPKPARFLLTDLDIWRVSGSTTGMWGMLTARWPSHAQPEKPRKAQKPGEKPRFQMFQWVSWGGRMILDGLGRCFHPAPSLGSPSPSAKPLDGTGSSPQPDVHLRGESVAVLRWEMLSGKKAISNQ